MFINVHKCLYKFGLGDINIWMMDSKRLLYTIQPPNVYIT